MSISSLYLDAFVGVSKEQSFSAASKLMGITQSALSQRIKNLEDEIGLTLFLRHSSGIKLTEQGQKLLRYCQTKESLELEVLKSLNAQDGHEVSGTIRIGAYSTILRSVVIPALSSFLLKHPHILCEFKCAQMDELPSLLNRGEVDFILMDYHLEKNTIESEYIGQEKLVLIENKKKTKRNHIILDHNFTDQASEVFLRKQTSKLKYQRSYFSDCYGIIDGVEQGLGRAIMSAHLVRNNPKIKISKELKPHNIDVYLYYHSQPFYTKLHQLVTHELKVKAHTHLS